MRRTVPILVTILVASVSWIFFKHFTVSGIGQLRVLPKVTGTIAPAEGGVSDGTETSRLIDLSIPRPPPAGSASGEATRRMPRIRVATFNAQSLDERKIAAPPVGQLLVRIAREFDVIAIQQVRSASDSVVPTLVNLMNKTGQQFDCAIGPRVGPAEAREQYAFVFNRRTLALDRGELYTVDDRSNALSCEPLVAWFRAIGPPESEGFTFSLINLRVDAATAIQERDLLDDLLLAVRNDGRQEDDVILAGDLQAGPGHLGPLDHWPGVRFAVADVPTNVAGTATLANLVFQEAATREFTGNAGVFDFLRRYNLTLDEALEVSDHLVVWAEFSVYEGGEARRMARAGP
jgi:deoxyribonuclease-1-like protein